MKITVAIPTYNSALTIRATLGSVLSQSRHPDEILVLDDGSTDDTVAIVESQAPGTVRVFRQTNGGTANARNRLFQEAQGDLIAYLDHDDIWHPRYLEAHHGAFTTNPNLMATFTGHTVFYGYGDVHWSDTDVGTPPLETVTPSTFLREYSVNSARFGSASFMCVPKSVLARIGAAPFQVSGADDAYLCTWFPLLGPVGFLPEKLCAYRIIPTALSTNKLAAFKARIDVLELLAPEYTRRASPELLETFSSGFALKRRIYAKQLMSAGRLSEARHELRIALSYSQGPKSIGKTAGILAASYLPSKLRPAWPSTVRDWEEPLP